MAKSQDKAQKADGRGGRYSLLPHCVQESEAFRLASPRCVKVLLVILRKHNGFNNGKVGLCLRELGHEMGNQNHAANARALGEAVARGFLEPTHRYPKGSRLADEWRLTFIPTRDGPATHEYLDWREGDAGTKAKPQPGKIRSEISSTERPASVVVSSTGLKRAVEISAAQERMNDENQPFSRDATVEDSTAHIVSQCSAPVRGPLRSASSVVKLPTAAPGPDELRERIALLIKEEGRGAQGRLAQAAAISGPSMSRFMRGATDLDERARVRLTCAIPKIATGRRFTA